MKRFLDIIVSFIGLLLLFPILIIISIFVRLTSNGPTFFQQKRIGFKGKEFVLFKFRTMTYNINSVEGTFEPGCTSRITRIGKYLRKYKLDELPQLWNVLRGDMSLVGPRPEVKRWIDVYPRKWAIVHTVKPGITDPASILYHNEEDILIKSSNPEITYKEIILPNKLKIYKNYVHNRSFFGDIKIIFQTISVLLTKKN